jgi:hypothetical protein
MMYTVHYRIKTPKGWEGTTDRKTWGGLKVARQAAVEYFLHGEYPISVAYVTDRNGIIRSVVEWGSGKPVVRKPESIDSMRAMYAK